MSTNTTVAAPAAPIPPAPIHVWVITDIADDEGGPSLYGTEEEAWAQVRVDAEEAARRAGIDLPEDRDEWEGFVRDHGWHTQHYSMERQTLPASLAAAVLAANTAHPDVTVRVEDTPCVECDREGSTRQPCDHAEACKVLARVEFFGTEVVVHGYLDDIAVVDTVVQIDPNPDADDDGDGDHLRVRINDGAIWR